MIRDRHSDAYDPDPDYDRPTRAEAEAELDPPEADQPDPEPSCYICDGIGHGIVTGWEEVEGKGYRPILSSPCPLEDTAKYEPFDDEYEPF